MRRAQLALEAIVDYQLVDADNHYYEAEDAFFRHGDEAVKRYVRWVSEGKRRYLVFGDRVTGAANTGVPNPTFNPCARPGAFHERLKELEGGKGERTAEAAQAATMGARYGALQELPEGYRHKDARIDMLDEQDVEKCLLFPTLGDCVEGLMQHDPVMAYKVFHAFNLWLDDDWGFAYKGRLVTPAYIPMLDPQLAAEELTFLLGKGVKAISLRPGPANGRSPADPSWDPFWAQVNESGIMVCYHAFGGKTFYGDAFTEMWGQSSADPGYNATLQAAFGGDRGILETTLALTLGNLFGRFPNVKIASVEMGCAWVPYALHALDHAGGLLERRIQAFGQTVNDLPSDVFKEHVYVSPFPEEDVVGLTEMIGVDRVLFGSDWPHPEGNIMPADYADCIQKLPEADIKKIMRDNTLALISSDAIDPIRDTFRVMAQIDAATLQATAEDLLLRCPPSTTEPEVFLRAQYDAGLAWVHYPVGYGGSDAGLDLQTAVDDLLAAAGAPPSGRVTNAIGAGQCAAVVLAFGSEEQKQHYLPRLFMGTAEWCQLFSEPGSGSDLSSLATRAVRDGDEWIVNGQKVWTSGAQRARYTLLLARTDPDAEKHAGLTAFAIDMHADTVEVRPLRQMNGGSEFSEVFLNGVRIPDTERLGDVGAGWIVSNATLAQERYNMPRIPNRGDGTIAALVDAWRARSDQQSPEALALKDQLLQHWVDSEVLRLLQAHAAMLRARGGSGPEGSLGKLATSVIGRRLAEFAPALLGADAMLIDGYGSSASIMDRQGVVGGEYRIQHSFVGSPAIAIAGGSDNIQRNIIGDRVLGLPREPSTDKGVPWSQTLRN